jgi:BolA protein
MEGNTSPDTHYELLVVSEAFNGQKHLKRHQIMNELLAEEFKIIHSISMRLLTKSEFESSN